MKKSVLGIIAFAAMMTACNNGKTSTAEAVDSVATDSAVYEGVVPAADSFGISYRLALASDSTKGYSLTQSYMKSETEIDTTFEYAGTVEETKATVGGKENTYYKLLVTGEEPAAYFMVLNDSTLRMVNSELEEPVAHEGMSYDLKLVK